MKINKMMNLLSSSLLLATPITTLSCNWWDKLLEYETFNNDFSMSHSIWNDPFSSGDPWGDLWMSNLESEGFDYPYKPDGPWNQSFYTPSKNTNTFDIDFVNDLLSSKKNSFGTNKNENYSARVHKTVSIFDDSNSAMMSIIAEGGYLKEVDEIYTIAGVSDANPEINSHLYEIAIDNASMEHNGIRKQIGVPYAFQYNGIWFTQEASEDFIKYYPTGIFDSLTIGRNKISDIITSNEDPLQQLTRFINKNGWTWNEMENIANKIISASKGTHYYYDYTLLLEASGSKLEDFLSAERYNSDNELLWNGISDDWNGDVLNILANQNSMTVREVGDIVSKMMESTAHDTMTPHIGLESIYRIQSSELWKGAIQELMPMPLYTNYGNDNYDDLVISTNNIFAFDDSQFFTSETGVNFRERALELLFLQSYRGKHIDLGNSYKISPYTTTEQILSNKGKNHYTDQLIDVMLSDTTTHSISSTRWLGDWFRKSVMNSTRWTGPSDNQELIYSFKPLDSVNRDINLYDDYTLNIK